MDTCFVHPWTGAQTDLLRLPPAIGSSTPETLWGRTRRSISLAIAPEIGLHVVTGYRGYGVTRVDSPKQGIQPPSRPHAAPLPFVFTKFWPDFPRRGRIPRYRLASRFSAPCVSLSHAFAARIRSPAGRTRCKRNTTKMNPTSNLPRSRD